MRNSLWVEGSDEVTGRQPMDLGPIGVFFSRVSWSGGPGGIKKRIVVRLAIGEQHLEMHIMTWSISPEVHIDRLTLSNSGVGLTSVIISKGVEHLTSAAQQSSSKQENGLYSSISNDNIPLAELSPFQPFAPLRRCSLRESPLY